MQSKHQICCLFINISIIAGSTRRRLIRAARAHKNFPWLSAQWSRSILLLRTRKITAQRMFFSINLILRQNLSCISGFFYYCVFFTFFFMRHGFSPLPVLYYTDDVNNYNRFSDFADLLTFIKAFKTNSKNNGDQQTKDYLFSSVRLIWKGSSAITGTFLYIVAPLQMTLMPLSIVVDLYLSRLIGSKIQLVQISELTLIL